MTDKELLELAAKAAGYDHWDFLSFDFDGLMNVYLEDGTQNSWNPLEDDGDVLRLSVKLNICIDQKQKGIEAWNFQHRVSSGVIKIGDDMYAATRRAIVCAAAEIGKSMT